MTFPLSQLASALQEERVVRSRVLRHSLFRNGFVHDMPVHPIHHLTIGTDALKVAKKFYGVLLPALGFDLVFDKDESFGYQREGFEIIIMKGQKTADDLYDGERRVGFDHLALNADSRAKVDECQKLLDDLGAEIDDEPAVVTDMGEDYYAMWVRDPSGLRIEVVYQGA